MALNLPMFEQLKLALKFIKFRSRQYRLRTSVRLVAETIYGKVCGVKWRSIYGDEYLSFEGIPFAQPPIGELRFRAPKEPEPWSDIKQCLKVRRKPIQVDLVFNMFQGNEDCLYLNVYTKTLNPTQPLPVLAYIYGGAFQVGEASRDIYSPDYFMKEDVVLITINYRVGPLGFMSFTDPEVGIPGNAGLKDQVLALKWIKKNCHFFGGDPENITVFGQSAGAGSAHYMMLTEQTKGLFHKGILMSGTAVAPWANIPPRNWAYRLAKAAGYTGENEDKSVCEFLTKLKASEMYKYSQTLLTKEERHERIPFCFGPTVEPYVSEECVIPKNPVEMMRKTWSNSIPLLIGGNSFEGLFMFSELRKYPDMVNELGNCEKIVPSELPLTQEQREEFGMKLKEIYFGDNEPSVKTTMEYCDLFSYKYFWHGIHRTVRSRIEYANAPTYLYRFDFDSKNFNLLRTLHCGPKVRGTCHGDDLSYLFYNGLAKKQKEDSLEYMTIRTMVSIFVKFALTGDPNKWENLVVTWPAVNKYIGGVKCLNISDELDIMEPPETEKLKLWDSMYPLKLLF